MKGDIKMKMDIYEYYHTDINNQKLYYTACKTDFEGWVDRDTTGKVFEADMPDGVKIAEQQNGLDSLCTKQGQWLHIHKCASNGKYFLIFTEATSYGYEWHQSIYKSLDVKEKTETLDLTQEQNCGRK